MEKSENEIRNILEKCQPDIERLRKMMLNMYAVSNIRYWYWCLSHFKKTEKLHEDIMKMDALTTSIVVSYGRLFGKGTKSTILNQKIIPDSLKQTHKSIINLRHERYAHHGVHTSIENNIRIKFNGFSFVITPDMQIGIWLGAPKEWASLFSWLDAHMYETMKKNLELLTKKTGIEWTILHGSSPHWI